MKSTKKIIISLLAIAFLVVYTFWFIKQCIPFKITQYADGGTIVVESKLVTTVRWNQLDGKHHNPKELEYHIWSKTFDINKERNK